MKRGIKSIINKYVKGKGISIIKFEVHLRDNRTEDSPIVKKDGYLIDGRLDSSEVKLLNEELESKGFKGFKALGVMHKDEDWSAPGLLYDRPISVNYLGLLVIPTDGLTFKKDKYGCITNLDIEDYSYNE